MVFGCMNSSLLTMSSSREPKLVVLVTILEIRMWYLVKGRQVVQENNVFKMDFYGSLFVHMLVLIMREKVLCLCDKTAFEIHNYPYNKCPDL